MPALKDIVRIQTGLYLKPNQFGDTVYIQLKDFNGKGQLATNLEPKIFITDRLSHHLLNDGDILFAAKGDENFAAVYKNEYASAVASSSFFVIKNFIGIASEYLAWFLNHPANQKKIKAEAKGSSIVSVSMKTLGNLEIQIPERRTQELILKVDKMRKQEKFIEAELIALKDQIIDKKTLTRICDWNNHG